MTDLRRTDRDLMRAMNTKLVLDVVRGVDMTSQADLIKATRLSTGTIVSIVRELRKLGMLADLGPGASRGGRKPTLLKLNSAAAVVLACRVGSNSATVGVLDLNGNILSRRDLVLAPGCGPEPFMAALVACLKDQLHQLAPRNDRVAGLGLSLHGPVDAARGVLLFSEHLGWRDVPFRDELGRALGLPVFADAETRAIAMAEQCWGAARGAQDFVLIELDSGIGMAQVLDGKLCRGSHSLAGELGFTTWGTVPAAGAPRQPLVLEQVASLHALCRQAGETASGDGHGSAVQGNIVGSEELCLQRLVEASRSGNTRARRILDNTARQLGMAVANVINLLDPELILLSGRMVSGDEDGLFRLVSDHARAYLVGAQDRAPRIEATALGADAALRGAARLVIDHFFSVENLAQGRVSGHGFSAVPVRRVSRKRPARHARQLKS
ncbi:MAG: hypothetical protein A3K19_03590 [Lentisphaerae bacterium RIFOXYB12_FULL_65_16]|nr:MAG: hypothetical protein A3K18_30120 [Lentisphaerae bacterium RIFOXYA12_64_32]OGV86597.1 MAG: hypothetical protein A3K19_03590 [Lentisphaerae bacterium RIFOXYB12_FULL_65_16]